MTVTSRTGGTWDFRINTSSFAVLDLYSAQRSDSAADRASDRPLQSVVSH